MSGLIFYTNPQSRGRIVHWMLEELDEPYETVWLEYGAGTKSSEYLAINPMGKIPALRHEDQTITETPAICCYLAARFPAKGLIPATEDPQLANFYRWLFFAAGPLEQSITARSLAWTVPEESKATVGFGSHEEVLDSIETALQPGPFICGKQFTAADVYVGSHIIWGMAFGGVEKRPAFEEYAARMTARPASIRAVQLNEERLKQLES